MTSGRKAGYQHSEETKNKISESMLGLFKTQEHKDRLSESILSLQDRCLARYLELKADYPDHEEFFEKNKEDLLFFLQDTRTEKELQNIRRYVETKSIGKSYPYEYSSSSYLAAEDVMIELLDSLALIRKMY